MPRAFAYILYGDSDWHFQEALFSIATLRLRHNLQPVIVLTDQPDRFRRIGSVQTIEISPTMQRRWVGSTGYHFRIKLEGLRYLLQNHVDSVMLLDTDTLIQTDLGRWFSTIESGSALLHSLEGRLGRRRFRRQYSRVLGRTFDDGGGRRFEIGVRTPMYNSGLIGLHRDHLPYLEPVLWLTDRLCEEADSHTAEQLALGYVLSTTGRVRTVGDRRVCHYWRRDRRRFIRSQFESLLESHSPEALISDPLLVRRRRTPSVWFRDKRRRLATSLERIGAGSKELARSLSWLDRS